MAINPYHTVEEIDGVRCSVVEKKITQDRADFIKRILEHNKMHVYVAKADDGSVTVGVDDLVFNPVHAIYNRSLKTPEGKALTPAYWFQKWQQDEYYWNYQ